MKVISLLQPWATLAVMGVKAIETRSWATDYRGPLLIHASKGRSGKLLATDPLIAAHVPDFDRLPFGMIIGEVCLADIVATGQGGLTEQQLAALTLEVQAFGRYPGKWCWLFRDAVLFDEPIPATGRLGLWEI